jgi:hypothetical protein
MYGWSPDLRADEAPKAIRFGGTKARESCYLNSRGVK